MIVTPRSPILKRGLLALMLTLVLVALAACGGSPSTGGSTGGAATAAPTAAPTAVPEAADPETRVKGFFDDFSAALNDPKITEAAAQDEWAGKLAKYAVPDEQAKAKETFKKSLGEFSQAIAQIGQLAGGQNVDLHLKFAFNDIKTKLEEKTADTAKVRLVSGTVKMELTGKDVEKLGDAAKQVNREMTLEEFMKSSSNKDAGLTSLKLVNGTWYISDLTKSS